MVTAMVTDILGVSVELQECPGIQGGLTFECKSDCALASPCPVPLGQLVMSARVDTCSTF